MTTLIDIGANITHESFRDDLDAVLNRAYQAGVHKLIVTGASQSGSEAAIALAKQTAKANQPKLYATCGIHPHEASHWTTEVGKQFSEWGKTPQVVAMGECGLDYYRDFSPRDKQQHAFAEQLKIASQLQKPVFLHQRDAHQDFMAILKQYKDQLDKVVVHCFTGTEAELKDYIELDCYIGITGWICDERRGHHLKEIVSLIPNDRLMIETDAPYLLPRDLKPKPSSRRNEPMYLPHIAETIATCLKKPFEQLAEETTQTAKAFFRI